MTCERALQQVTSVIESCTTEFIHKTTMAIPKEKLVMKRKKTIYSLILNSLASLMWNSSVLNSSSSCSYSSSSSRYSWRNIDRGMPFGGLRTSKSATLFLGIRVLPACENIIVSASRVPSTIWNTSLNDSWRNQRFFTIRTSLVVVTPSTMISSVPSSSSDIPGSCRKCKPRNVYLQNSTPSRSPTCRQTVII